MQKGAPMRERIALLAVSALCIAPALGNAASCAVVDSPRGNNRALGVALSAAGHAERALDLRAVSIARSAKDLVVSVHVDMLTDRGISAGSGATYLVGFMSEPSFYLIAVREAQGSWTFRSERAYFGFDVGPPGVAGPPVTGAVLRDGIRFRVPLANVPAIARNQKIAVVEAVSYLGTSVGEIGIPLATQQMDFAEAFNVRATCRA